METIDHRIIKVMADVFNIPAENINIDSSQDNIEEWDSVNHLSLVVALEEEFGISIPLDDVGIMTNFQLVKTIIEEQIKA